MSSFDPAAGELVHESERSRVIRVWVDGRTVIRKEPLGPDADRWQPTLSAELMLTIFWVALLLFSEGDR